MKAITQHWEVVRSVLREEKKRKKSSLTVEEATFLPAAIEIIERPVSPTSRYTTRVLLVMLVLTVLWLFFGRVDVVASATGRVTPAGNVKLIQSAQAGVVRAIHVRDGQAVRAGQVMIELDPTASTAEATQARQGLQAAQLTAARARAILAGLDGRGLRFIAPEGVSPETAANHRDLAAAQLAELEAGSSGATSNRKAASAARQESLIHAARLAETLPLLDEQIAANETLLEKGYVSRLRVIEMRRQRLAAAGERDAALQAANRAEAQLAAAGSLGAQSRSEARARLLSELAASEGEIGLRREELVKAMQRSNYQRLVSPVDGTVAQLSTHTIGGVVDAAKPIMVVVPANVPLVVEVKVLNRDAGFISVGQPTAVKLEAFPFTRHGTVPGVTESISSGAVEDEQLGLVYIARVRLKQATIDRGDRIIALLPGMAATADIGTGKRSLISYLVSPIDQARKEAGRER